MWAFDRDGKAMVEIPLVMIFVDMAENALSKIADNPEYREELLTATQSIDDWVQEKLGKVRTSIPRTKNENFSHLISMGYQ